MKYLKRYKIFESRFSDLDVKDVFEPYINWNLVEDVKDMSLEYIDEGINLNIEVNYKDNDNNYYILTIYFNHDETNIYWNPGNDRSSSKDVLFTHLTEGPYELEPIDKSKILYYFYFTIDGYGVINRDELLSRIKETYPDENINKEHSEL